MICKVCGAQIPDDAEGCEFCGAEVEGTSNEETKVINTDEINAAAAERADDVIETDDDEIFDENEKIRRKQMKKMMEDKKKQLSEIEQRRNEKRQKQRRNRAVVIGLICALAAGAAGVSAYYISKNVYVPPKATETPVPTVAATIAVPTAPPVVSPSPIPTPAATAAASTASGKSSSTDSGSASSSSSSGSSSSGSQSWTATGKGSSSQRTATNSATPKSSSSSASSSGSNSSAAKTSDSGVVTTNLDSKLATGGEVIYNNSTGKYLMTFTSGGVRYYANVSAGSTTEQVKNKSYTITASPTQETYNGNTVYEISAMSDQSGEFVIADSSTRLLTDNDIKGMSKDMLALARNEIYARHGRKFKTPEYNTYFSSKAWYKVNPNYNYNDDNSNLNETEVKNVQFILNAESK